MLPLLILALNPLMVPWLLVRSEVLWWLNMFLEYHWKNWFGRLMCGCVWVTVLFIGNNSNNTSKWYQRRGLLIATVWWLITVGLDITGVLPEPPFLRQMGPGKRGFLHVHDVLCSVPSAYNFGCKLCQQLPTMMHNGMALVLASHTLPVHKFAEPGPGTQRGAPGTASPNLPQTWTPGRGT